MLYEAIGGDAWHARVLREHLLQDVDGIPKKQSDDGFDADERTAAASFYRFLASLRRRQPRQSPNASAYYGWLYRPDSGSSMMTSCLDFEEFRHAQAHLRTCNLSRRADAGELV